MFLFNNTFNTFVLLHGVRLIVKDYLGRKEMFYLMTPSTHFLHLHGVRPMVKDYLGRKEMFYLMTPSTHFYTYMVSDQWLRTT